MNAMENQISREIIHQFRPDSADEKIGIARIKLSLPLSGTTAVVYECREADRALSAWKRASKLVHACEYAVIFTDGVIIRGRFSLGANARSLPSLSCIIQAAFGLGRPARGYCMDGVLIDRHGAPMKPGMLRHYSLANHS
jgi:hypothetical protein